MIAYIISTSCLRLLSVRYYKLKQYQENKMLIYLYLVRDMYYKLAKTTIKAACAYHRSIRCTLFDLSFIFY